MEKPRVERVDGLSPTILIDQRTVSRNPRSTVGTITEILDHLRLLYARLGEARCPTCETPVRGQTVDEIVDRWLERADGRRLVIAAPVVRDRKGEYRRDLQGWLLKGYTRAWIDGEERRLDEPIKLRRNVRHTIELVVDRIRAERDRRGRLVEAIERSCDLSDGWVVLHDDEGRTAFSTRNTCPEGHGDFPELEPRLFSFNSPRGACPSSATASAISVSSDPDQRQGGRRSPEKSIREGCAARDQ